MSDCKERIEALFTYIKSVLELGFKVNTDISKYKSDFLRIEKDFPKINLIKTIFDNPDQEEFFIIKYPEIKPPPSYPKILEGWMYNYPDQPEVLLEDESNELSEENNTKRKNAWVEFKPEWEKWREDNKDKLSVEKIFRRLYTLASERDERYEFVIGHGIVSWETMKKSKDKVFKTIINYPLVTREVNVNFDANSKTLKIESIEDNEFALEDLVIADYIGDVKEVKELFNEMDYDITAKESYISLFENILNRFQDPITHNLANGILVEDKQQNPLEVTNKLKIFDTWVLCYRKRRQNAEIKDIENFLEIINQDEELKSNSLNSFIADASNEIEEFTYREYNETQILQDKKVLFPLPFNEEQINILDRVEKFNNVIVLGPPGTGKSHTIANLISHFLARGERVLVASQKDQALDVLLEKIPEKLRGFCIPILTNISDGQNKMQEAFTCINEAVSSADVGMLQREINSLSENIDKIGKELIETQNKIKHGSKGQLLKIKTPKGTLLPIDLTQELQGQGYKHDWLNDDVVFDISESNDNIVDIIPKLPLSEEELERLKVLKYNLNKDLQDLYKEIIPSSNLVTPTEFDKLVKNLLKIQELDDKIISSIPDAEFKNNILNDNSIEQIQKYMSLIQDIAKNAVLMNSLDELSKDFIPSSKLISPAEFEKLINDLIQIKQIDERISSCIPELEIKDNNIQDIEHYASLLQEKVNNDLMPIEQWQKDFLSYLKNPDETTKISQITDKILSLSSKLNKQYKNFNVFKEVAIKSPYEINGLIDFTNKQIIKLKKGEDIYSFVNNIFKDKKEKFTLSNISVESKTQLSSIQDWQHILEFAEILDLAEKLSIYWNKLANRYNLPKMDMNISTSMKEKELLINEFYLPENSIKEQLDLIDKMNAINILLKNEELSKNINELSELFINNSEEILRKYSIKEILEAFQYRIKQEKFIESKNIYNSLKQELSSCSGGLNTLEINNTLHDCLLKLDTAPTESILNWTTSYNKIYQLESLQSEYKNLTQNVTELCKLMIVNYADILKKYSIIDILKLLECKLNQENYISSKITFEKLKKEISSYLGNSKSHEINNILNNCLLSLYATPDEAITYWTNSYNRICELEAIQTDFTEFTSLLSKMEAITPLWARKFQEISDIENNEFYPNYWQETFQFKAWKTYISNICIAARQLSELENKLSRLSERLRNFKTDLIFKTTQLNLKKNMTHENMRALGEWQMALKKLGKSKGKYANKRIKQLQDSTRRAKSAIPVWIMPLYKVSETIPAEVGSFDVVIIDEASQSDIRAFLSVIRGKKIIIVGDPEQVSPSNIGIDESYVQRYIKEFLQEIPCGQYFDLKTSIYDIAKMTLGHNNVLMLKEHFRCLPEIIKFSNDLCYAGKIIPLRSVPPNERLEPVLERIYVETGKRRDNQDINEQEAKVICEKIYEIVNNPEYKKKTIGIISLTGSDQAKFIHNMLNEYVSIEQQSEFKIRVGNAATFQGDERNIMFLSMIVSPNDVKNITALASIQYKQRFNVAVSRAKDKVVLVHSIKLEELSNSECMRYKLLEFMTSGQFSKVIEENKKKFDSDFEEVVYTELTKRGYILTPQVSVGPYSVDLVVEGGNFRLGIECDGDKYHPPDKWFEDNLRQKHLERMGWSIYRIWGSDFYNDKNRVLNEIVEYLNRLHIYPAKIAHTSHVDMSKNSAMAVSS